jgi:hypothetical protein
MARPVRGHNIILGTMRLSSRIRCVGLILRLSITMLRRMLERDGVGEREGEGRRRI